MVPNIGNPLAVSAELGHWQFKRCSPRSEDTATDLKPVMESTAGVSQSDKTSNPTGQHDPRLNDWLDVKCMPSNIHVDLMAHGIIDDPSLDLNEADVQWVGENDWLYRCPFETTDLMTKAHDVDLVFQGLDTIATVRINGKQCHHSENGFIAYRIPAADHIVKTVGHKNEIVVRFESALRHGKKLEQEHGKRTAWNGDASRVFVRKPQYHYGWDWGPTLLTCGFLGTPQVQVYNHRIEDVGIIFPEDIDGAVDVSCSVRSCGKVLNIKDILQDKGASLGVTCSLLDVEGTVSESMVGEPATSQIAPSSADSPASVRLVIPPSRLEKWWPRGYGEQHLYTLRIVLHCEKSGLVDICEKRIGFRRIEVKQTPLSDQPGTSFFFQVNGVPIFLAGSNWIPADSFPARMNKSRYREWLQLLVDGGQNAIRIWGGGYYEDEHFYDICDELGILVWQDFMFACGSYPADIKAFRDNVQSEATSAVKRLHHHASLAIFAGNNEDYQIAESEKLGWNPKDDNQNNWLKSKFPARYIYERILPEVVAKNCQTFYHPGSPWNNGEDTRDPSKGDNHQWNVWHGSQEAYQDWDKLGGRFISEFGMHGHACMKTVKSFVSDEIELYPQSRTLQMHNKADGGETRLAHYLVKNVRYAMGLEDYIYASQLMQADCLASAYQLWRREWRGEGRRHCGGALVWQLNDVYPCISWAIADFYLRPKLSYFAIKRMIQPITINIKRTKGEPASSKDRSKAELWVANSTLADDLCATLEVSIYDIADGKRQDRTRGVVRLSANCTTEFPPVDLQKYNEQDIVVAAKLLQIGSGDVMAKTTSWPDPLKFVKPNGARVQCEVVDGGSAVVVHSERPVKGVALGFGAEDVILSDNGFDLMPGDRHRVEVKWHGIMSDTLTPRIRWYTSDAV